MKAGGDTDHRGQRRLVRVMHHHRAGLRVEPLPQAGRVPGQGQGAGRTGPHDTAPERELSSG